MPPSIRTELAIEGELLPPEGPDAAPPFSPSFRAFVAAWNDLQGYSTPDLHVLIADWLETSWRSGERELLLMVFRDAGKSTLVGLFCAWLLMTDPNQRILVLSADHALACKMTRNVRRVIERHCWTGHLKPKRSEQWAADQFTVERDLNLRDPSLLARGITSNITGSRADIVICDDVEVPNTCDTTQKRLDLRERLAEIGFIVVPGGSKLFVGTPHTYYSIYADSARPELDETVPFLDGYKRLVLPIIDADGSSRWPERFSLEHIHRLQSQAGPTKFRSQMMLMPAHAREIRLDPDRLRPYDCPLEHSHANGRSRLTIDGRAMASVACWWDPSYARPTTGDASVIAAVFVDAEGSYWLHAIRYLEGGRARSDTDDEASRQCRAVAAFLALYELPAVTVENNGLGRFLPSILRRVLHMEGVKASVIEHSSRTAKDQRILDALDPLLAARRLHVHQSVWSTPFIEEMREWTPGGGCRDDGLDAVSGCIASLPVRIPTIPGRGGTGTLWQAGATSFRARTDFAI